MIEGWNENDYLVLFEDEASSFDHAYGIAEALPGYHVIGLKGWDDFIVENANGGRFTVPTVPLLVRYLTPFVGGTILGKLVPDETVKGRIKWYITPIIFGGDPNLGDNVTWVTINEHAQLVKWWNRKYREVSEKRDETTAT
jgi:hypothetical protein